MDWDGVLDFHAYLRDEVMPMAYLQRVQRPAPVTRGA